MPESDDPTLDAGRLDRSDGAPQARATMPGPGQRFAGRYLIEGLLGRGGMGTVLQVRDELLGGERIALKILDHTSPGAIARFRREVLLARRITSPHVARTHDLGEHEGTSYLTMELVVGRSLGAVLAEEGPLAPARAARIGAAIARGLAAAHEAGVVHRDLKPDNVLIGDDGRVVVTDFGIARALAGAPDAAHLTGGIAGTPHYMAPEQVTQREVDARADLFALGVLLFECLAGELPFEGETPLAAALARVQGPPRALASLRPAPPPLAALLDELLAREPEARPAGALPVAERLAALLPGLSEAGTPRPVVPDAPITPTGTGASERAPLLAVMPFEHRGDPRERPLAEAVRQELIDLVARTRGMAILARSATEAPAEARAHGATQLVEAAIQTGSGRLRATVRLLDPASGRQLWTERIEGEVGDPFTGPERTAQRIVEHLRLALETVAAPSRVPPQAIAAFKEARARLRGLTNRGSEDVVALLEQAITMAPRFAPALALHAIACVRAWFLPSATTVRDWSSEVRASTARALLLAPHIAEAHHAAALLAWHEGRLREAAAHAREALSIAPTYADGMAFVGMLEVEAGRDEAGLARIRVAHELEPTLRIGIIEPARWHGLYGDLAEYDRLLAIMERELRDGVMAAQSLVRVGAWRGRRDYLERGLALLAVEPTASARALTDYARVALSGPGTGLPTPDPMRVAHGSPRFETLALQLSAEGAMLAGRADEAMQCITRASERALADLAWIERCPLLEPLRGRPEMNEARQRVLLRVRDIWVDSGW